MPNYTKLTINADPHPLMKRMHRPLLDPKTKQPRLPTAGFISRGSRMRSNWRASKEKAHKLKDLALHRHDLNFAAQCLKSINEEAASDFMQDALWRCAIVHYVKCFGEGARKPLRARAAYKEHAPEALDAQEHFWNLRNKHIAHEVSAFSTVQVGAVINPPDRQSRIAKIFCPAFRVDTLEDGAFGNLTLLIEHALEWVNQEQDRLCDPITVDLEKESHHSLMRRPDVVYAAPQSSDIRRGRRSTPTPDTSDRSCIEPANSSGTLGC